MCMLQEMLSSPVLGVGSAYSVLDSGALEALAAGLQVVASAKSVWS